MTSLDIIAPPPIQVTVIGGETGAISVAGGGQQAIGVTLNQGAQGLLVVEAPRQSLTVEMEGIQGAPGPAGTMSWETTNW